jgi:5'(3')-deoxyribonucleotidase
MKISYIDLDMDEVLVDFISGACEAHGVSREEMETHRVPGTWSIQEALGKATTGHYLTTKEFWAPINKAGAEFWENLKPFEWTDTIIELVECTKLPWFVVTSPSFDETSYFGKIRWLKRKLGNSFDRAIITPHKHRFAFESLLIDDRERNLEKHVDHGGSALLFPSLGNSLYCYASCPVSVIASEFVKKGLIK